MALTTSLAALFTSGSGTSAQSLALTLQIIGTAVTVLVFAWIVHHIQLAHGNEEIKTTEALMNVLKATCVLVFVITVIFI